jgi:hypothetical protein
MSRLIQETIRKALADELLFGKLVTGGKVTVDLEGAGDDAKVKLTVTVPDYATGKTGPLTGGTLRDDGWRELPLPAGKPTTLLIPTK